jgi:tryptophan synthase alpha chain
MSNSIDLRLEKIQKEKRTGLMTHAVVGYPTLEKTVDIVLAMERAGADFVELQIPFSDPLADGPTIQHACEVALQNGVHTQDAFSVVRDIAKKSTVPLLFMSYFNIVYQYGVEQFCADAAAAGVSGLIIPDAPLEAAEHEGLLKACTSYNLRYIVTLSPASNDERLQKNAQIAQGFAYCMARQGVTGAAGAIETNIEDYLNNIRSYISVPLAVGFGISSKERMQAVSPYCDVAIVGSAVIDVLTTSVPDEAVDNVERFIRSLL